jgi:hypothetical protein
VDSAIVIACATAVLFFWGEAFRVSAMHSQGLHSDLVRHLSFEEQVYSGSLLLLRFVPFVALADFLLLGVNYASGGRISASAKTFLAKLSILRLVLLASYFLVGSAVVIAWLSTHEEADFDNCGVVRLVLKPGSQLAVGTGQLYYVTRTDHDTVFIEREGGKSTIRIISNDQITEVALLVTRTGWPAPNARRAKDGFN